MENKDNHINVELKEDVAEGIYSNLAVITHSPSEFVVDFIRVMPGMPKAPVKARIILTPEHAQRLLYALQDNIDRFEAVHGPIREDFNDDEPNIPVTFGGPTGQA